MPTPRTFRGPSSWGGATSGPGGGGAPSDAPFVTWEADGDLSNEVLIGSIILPPDTIANRPAAASTVAGSLFFPNNESGTIYRSDTSTWTELLGLDAIAAGTRWAPDTLTTPGTLYGNVTLSGGIAGGDTLAGGNAASEALTLASTSHVTRGVINLRDRTMLISENKTFSTQTTPVALLEVSSSRTITLSSATASSNGVIGYGFAPTVVYGAAAEFGTSYLFQNVATYKADTTSRATSAIASFFANPTVQGDTNTFTITTVAGVLLGATLNRVNAGTLALAFYQGVSSNLTVGAGVTVTELDHFACTDVANSGTVTTQYGLNIPPLSGAATNIGISNGSTTVYGVGASTISAVSSTVRIDRTAVRLNNTSGGLLTITSTPTIADGQQGQVIHMVNTSANTITVQDESILAGSNLQLGAATRAIAQYGTLSVMFNITTGFWHEIAFA